MTTIYFSAPTVTRSTPRYERYYQLIAKRYPKATIIESCEEFVEYTKPAVWKARFEDILKDIDMLIFIRDETKHVGAGTLSEILTARNAGKRVLMAITIENDELKLLEWNKFHFEIHDKENRRNYARFIVNRKIPSTVQPVAHTA